MTGMAAPKFCRDLLTSEVLALCASRLGPSQSQLFRAAVGLGLSRARPGYAECLDPLTVLRKARVLIWVVG